MLRPRHRRRRAPRTGSSRWPGPSGWRPRPTSSIVTAGSKATTAQVLGHRPRDRSGAPPGRRRRRPGAPLGCTRGRARRRRRRRGGPGRHRAGLGQQRGRLGREPARRRPATGPSYAGLIGTDTAAERRRGRRRPPRRRRRRHRHPHRVARPPWRSRSTSPASVADQLGSSGKAAHGWLGVWGADGPRPRRRRRPGPGRSAGYSPALKAGIVPGDIITAVGDDAVADLGDLVAAVRRRLPGDPVDITMVRDGKRTVVHVQLADGDSSPPPARPAGDRRPLPSPRSWHVQRPIRSFSVPRTRARATMERDDERNPD